VIPVISDIFTARRLLAQYICYGPASIRHKSVFYQQTAKRRITETTPYDSLYGLWFSDAKDLSDISMAFTVTPIGGAKYTSGKLKYTIFDQYPVISQKRCKRG